MDADPGAGTNVDAFGMTPFHILALSQTPNLSLLQEFTKVYKVDIIRTKGQVWIDPNRLFMHEPHTRFCHGDSIIASADFC
jgi:hypothetical protein